MIQREKAFNSHSVDIVSAISARNLRSEPLSMLEPTHHSKYKHGKQLQLTSFKNFQEKMQRAQLSQEEEGFVWLLFYSGCRKSEGYERTVEDTSITSECFVVDFQERKKHGAHVPPLELPLAWPGISVLVELAGKAAAQKAWPKSVFFYEDGKRRSRIQRARWLFPNIQSTRAWELVKQVLGPEYYAHYLRLNRLSQIGSDPSANITRLKSFSGIKSISSLESYLGVSRGEQQKALSWMQKEIEQK